MENARTEKLLMDYNPQLAIVVYKSNQSNDNFYLESHQINENGALLEGKPLLQETIQQMVDLFFDERKNTATIKGMIPENLLSFDLLPGGNYKMIWYRPAEIRVIHFANSLKLNTEKVWVPATLYVSNKNSLDVYALKANTRPKETTLLFRAPYHNVGDDGDVCLGSANVAKPKVLTYANLIKYWEDLFWLSEFTHANGMDHVKTDLHKVWTKLINSKTKLKWSDLNELVQLKKTLKSVL